MALIIEDGGIVSNANSYVSVADLTSFATARGITISGNAEVLLIQAMDYLESLDGKFKGARTERDQPLSWPRAGVTIEDWNWSSNEIPRQLVNAQLNLAIEIGDGHDPLNPTPVDLPIVKERVEGAVDVQYANPSSVSKVNKEQPSQVHINLLLKRSGLQLVRS